MSVDRLLELVNGSTQRRMFGGVGVFCEGRMFAIGWRESLYLKVDDEGRAEFEELGSSPFKPNQRMTSRSYFEVPAAVLDDDAELAAWAHRAVEIAREGKGG
jgi:DNA transformation protein